MLRSSLGFHTLTLSLFLERKDVPRLIKAFGKYSHNTGLIQMYFFDGTGTYRNYQPKHGSDDTFILPLRLHINYYREYMGIKWMIRCNNHNDDFKSYIVDATINPKFLGGIQDYITAATYDDMESAIAKFNSIAREISPLLKTFDCYSLKRIDYCINFCINELTPGCSPERIMTLIRRSDIPPHYTEWEKYHDVAHRTKSSSSSFYLMTSSVNINCYSKYEKLLEQTQKNEERGYPPIPQFTLDAARNIIRFEIQCKYHKTYTLSSRAKESGNSNRNKYESLLTNVACNDIIGDYFKKVVGKGDWHTLQCAIHIIEAQHFNKQKEKRLIDALRFVNECRSLAKAKEAYKDHRMDELDEFKRTLKELSCLNINPVTIPKWWGIKHIPNLLYTYYDRVEQEKSEKEIEEFRMECLNEHLKKSKYLYI